MKTNEDNSKNRHMPSKLLKTISACAILVLSGSAMATTGAIKIAVFLKNISAYKTLTAHQILHGLILPHIMLLSGIGFISWGFIFLIRQAIIQSRLKHNSI
ncbi:MAG: hypothetical protein DRI57_17670 [Deltaproteobacteria bacterium]|nr:MAG: hypothetical protein DRI57_17670 [Deltaproteobacteria bacterium]